MAAGRIKGITIEIGGDTTKLVKALSSVDNAISKTQTNLKDINKLLKLDPGNTELLKQKQTELNSAISLTKDRLEELKNAQSQMSEGTSEWDALQREIIATEQGLQGLEKELNQFGSVSIQKLKVVGEKFQEVGGKIENAGRSLSKISGLAAAGLGAIGKLGYDAVQSADELNTLAKQTGVSTDELQKWGYAAELVDVDVTTITSSMKKMKKGLDSNSDAFEALGVKTKDSSGNFRNSTDIFYDTIAALSKIDNETERDIAAMDIFGKSADDLAGIIDDGGAALKAYGEEAENLGLIIGGDTLDKLNETNDTIDKLKATIGASFAEAGATIAQTFAPAMEKVAEVVQMVAEKIRNLTPEQAEMITKILAVVAALSPVLIVIGKLVSAIGFVMTHLSAISAVLSAILSPIGLVVAAIGALVAAFVYFYNTNDEFRDKVNGVIENIKAAFSAFVDKCKEWLDKIIAFISPVVESVKGYVSALVELIRTVIDTITNIISDFMTKHETGIKMWMETIKTVFKVGWEWISGIAKTVFTAIRDIIKTVLDVITNIVKAFTSLLKGDWKSALDYLKQAAQSAIDGVKNIFNNLKNNLSSTFSNILSSMRSWGSDMINSLVDGIRSKISAVTDAISSVAGTIKSYIHFSEPDIGPLSDFNTYMPDMIKNMVKGIENGIPQIKSAMYDMTSAMVPDMSGSMARSTTNNANVNITVYGAQGQDVRELADIIQERINAQVYSSGAAFA